MAFVRLTNCIKQQQQQQQEINMLRIGFPLRSIQRPNQIFRAHRHANNTQHTYTQRGDNKSINKIISSSAARSERDAKNY